jgi:hypothetical protein
MTGNSGLARQDDMIVKPGAPGNSRLRDHNAPGAQLHVVSDLNQIIGLMYQSPPTPACQALAA